MTGITTSEQLKRHYDDYYAGGNSECRMLGALDKAANIVSLCSDLPHRSILEIGAGEGSILQRLSEQGFGGELYALEISASGVETIQQRGIVRLRECLLFDGYDIPYSDGRFDLAILSHVIEHIEFPRKLLYEAARVARYVFVEVPLEDNLRLKPDFVFDNVGHINSYSPKTIRRLMQTCHLKVLRQTVTNLSKTMYTYQRGKKGLMNYYVKEYTLKLLPNVATSLFTYHSSLVGEAER